MLAAPATQIVKYFCLHCKASLDSEPVGRHAKPWKGAAVEWCPYRLARLTYVLRET